MTPPASPTPDPARPATDGLNPLLHEPNRLGILTALLSHRDGLSFTELKERLALTDGNLSRHLSTLQENGLVDIRKGMNGRRPLTTVRLTAAGRRRFLDYLELLEGIVTTALATAETPEPAPGGVGLNPA
ncbi:MAG: transcriptional regulator [Fimbriiglobus sp.]|jgi:DNA-binding MarR family transcriptional regulator|nr:transcriptional regulator [Fimbriiglobus sp.]